jgi:hypothetical protein
MYSNVLAWYEKKEHIDEMKSWDKGKLKIWEQQVADNFPSGARILDIGSGLGREAFVMSGEGEIYVPEDGIVLYCLSRLK